MTKTKRQKRALIFLFFWAALALVLFFSKNKPDSQDISKPIVVTKHDSITFEIPSGWVIYKSNKNYDMDIGYFKQSNKDEELLCRINATTAKPDRQLTYEEFLENTITGKILIESHRDQKIGEASAWRGNYTFSAEGIGDPAQNDRILFRWKDVYGDLTLSYSETIGQNSIAKCKDDFENFLKSITLH